MGLFKACDVRGIADTELTDDVVWDIGRALGTKLTGRRVVVCGDFRLSTPRLKKRLVEALVSSGCAVIDVGQAATPMFYYALYESRAEGGVMVTASHNPAAYNGFKIVLGQLPISVDELKELEGLAARRAGIDAMGTLETLDIADGYIHSLASKTKRGALKIVLDAGNGAASNFAPQLFRTLGYDVVELFCAPDGRFPNRSPNPSYARNLTQLIDTVRRTGADLGIAFDGDGDRAAFVDETGRTVNNDDILILLAKECLEERKGAVIHDAKCSMAVPEEIATAGGRPIMVRSGHTFIKRAFLDEDALFAGEVSGHFFFRELGCDDGMFAGLKICDYVARHGRLSLLTDALPHYLLTQEMRVSYAGDDKEELLARTAAALTSADCRVLRTDGVRAEFADGWGLIRSSVTEPIFTLRFEAKSQRRLAEIQRALVGATPDRIRPAVEAEVFKTNEEH